MTEATTLAALAAQEDALVEQLCAVADEPDQVLFRTVHTEVSQLYKLLYHEYVKLLLTTSSAAIRLEVLKRTVFLRWYVMTEPDLYTGIDRIDPSDTSRVFEVLDIVISRNQLDTEFDWMLAYYAEDGWDFALQPAAGENGAWPNVTAFLKAKTMLSIQASPNYSAKPTYVDPGTLAGRGQLSQYWLRVINRESLL